MTSKIDLLIFTCEGREHLIDKTISSFEKHITTTIFSKKILAIDGNYDLSQLSFTPDLIIHSKQRQGYIHNIINGLKHIDSEYFFWLEDDWDFNRSIDIKKMIKLLINDDSIIQLILGKENLSYQNLSSVSEDIYISDFGFSANPCICRTSYLKNVFMQILIEEKNEETKLLGFENFITRYMKKNNLYNIIAINKKKSYVTHSGFLESTAREYHMINSIDKQKSDINKNYISGLGNNKEVLFRNKILMLPKLWISTIDLSYRLLYKRQAYDFALRIYFSYLRRFNS